MTQYLVVYSQCNTIQSPWGIRSPSWQTYKPDVILKTKLMLCGAGKIKVRLGTGLCVSVNPGGRSAVLFAQRKFMGLSNTTVSLFTHRYYGGDWCFHVYTSSCHWRKIKRLGNLSTQKWHVKHKTRPTTGMVTRLTRAHASEIWMVNVPDA